jgi:hypothetical protein
VILKKECDTQMEKLVIHIRLYVGCKDGNIYLLIAECLYYKGIVIHFHNLPYNGLDGVVGYRKVDRSL